MGRAASALGRVGTLGRHQVARDAVTVEVGVLALQEVQLHQAPDCYSRACASRSLQALLAEVAEVVVRQVESACQVEEVGLVLAPVLGWAQEELHYPACSCRLLSSSHTRFLRLPVFTEHVSYETAVYSLFISIFPA